MITPKKAFYLYILLSVLILVALLFAFGWAGIVIFVFIFLLGISDRPSRSAFQDSSLKGDVKNLLLLSPVYRKGKVNGNSSDHN